MPRKTLIAFAAVAALAGMSLAACETDSYAPAAANRPLNRACRPGDTEAGTRSGLSCDAGSSTSAGRSDANVQGAASAGGAPAIPGPN